MLTARSSKRAFLLLCLSVEVWRQAKVFYCLLTLNGQKERWGHSVQVTPHLFFFLLQSLSQLIRTKTKGKGRDERAEGGTERWWLTTIRERVWVQATHSFLPSVNMWAHLSILNTTDSPAWVRPQTLDKNLLEFAVLLLSGTQKKFPAFFSKREQHKQKPFIAHCPVKATSAIFNKVYFSHHWVANILRTGGRRSSAAQEVNRSALRRCQSAPPIFWAKC